jgi:hypothetical protein
MTMIAVNPPAGHRLLDSGVAACYVPLGDGPSVKSGPPLGASIDFTATRKDRPT